MGVEITVLKTLATEQAYLELLPQFEKASGHTVKTTFAGTVAVKKLIAAGEQFDLLMMASHDLDVFMAAGIIAPGSRVDIARSGVGLAVRRGAARPDIASPQAFINALLAAKTVGYSTGPSGDYFMTLLERLSLSDKVKPKLRQVPTGDFVGRIVANGEAEIGIQQVSELSTYPGIDYVGPLPGDLQKITIFTSGIAAKAKEPEAARALVRFITSPEAGAAFRKRGMEPG